VVGSSVVICPDVCGNGVRRHNFESDEELKYTQRVLVIVKLLV